MLEISHVKKSFGKNHVLRDVSMKVNKGCHRHSGTIRLWEDHAPSQSGLFGKSGRRRDGL